MFKIANANQQKVFILGSKNEIIEKAEQQLKAKYPRVTFAHHHGYINLKDETVIKRIDTFDPDYILWVWGIQNKKNGLPDIANNSNTLL